MEEAQYQQDFSADFASRLRDLEERQRLLRDRILLIGQSVVNEREKNLKELQELKRTLIIIKEEHGRIKELLERVSEQLQDVPRREELALLQRQFNLFRGH